MNSGQVRKSELEDPWMPSSPLSNHPTHRDAALDDLLDLPLPTAAPVLPTQVRNGEELDFDKTDVAALFNKKYYKVHI